MPRDDTPEPAPLDLENNPEHAKRAVEVLRSFSDAQLSQGIACRRAFIDRVPGFKDTHIVTKAGDVLAQLAEDEQWRRRDVEVRRQARMANHVAIGSLVVSVVTFIFTFVFR